MDWSNRKYYCVSFDVWSLDMRIGYLRLINNKLKIHPYKKISKQNDEQEERGCYQFLLSIPAQYADAVEYELRKAQRNDD